MRDPNSDDEVTGVSVSEDTVNNALRRVAARQARRKAKPASSGNTETSSMRVDAMAAAYGAECSAALDGMDDDLQENFKTLQPAGRKHIVHFL
jgi:P2-related tail formation protein